LRGDSTSNINILHSDITNSNSDGAAIQNLNLASIGLYDIDIVESNLTGQITGIDPATITTIDDPNVKNGPVYINGNGQDNSLVDLIKTIFAFIIAILIAVIVFPLIIVLIIIKFIRNLFRQ